MFNTFVGINHTDTTKDSPERRCAVAARACVECRRRKTKCVGTQPCAGCLACNVECIFPAVRRRGRKSRRMTITETSNGDYEALIKILFPNTPIKSLLGLSPAALLDRAKTEGDLTPSTSNDSPSATPPDIPIAGQSRSGSDLEANERLYKLQCHSSAVFEWDETSPETRHAVEDDVNALSLSQDRKSSFVGISSVAAAVRALKAVLPAQLMEQKPAAPKRPSQDTFHDPSTITTPSTPNRVSSYREEQRLIDAYFAGIHVFAPVIHEPSFRNKYLTSQGSQDRSWLALLNMVLALGSVTSSAVDSNEDFQYYHLAQRCLSLESFGSGRLETLQALILMGGQYLHFRNRPNMASAIMGACYRFASGLGLHLRSPDGSSGQISLQDEVKRRNWWTIYVLDTWGSMTLGRPSGVVGPLIDLPRNILDDHRGELPPTHPTIHSPLIHNIQLCQMINRIQNRLLVNSVLNAKELQFYDDMLVSWFEGLPSFLRSSDPSAPDLEDARLVLKWRYQNIRLLLHRPIILDTVIRKTQTRYLSPSEQAIVTKCRDIAADSIFSIQTEWRPTKICGWNAVWFLFQACLIPLMALTVESPENSDYQSWSDQVQTGITVCNDLSQLSPVGQKTKAFLEQLFLTVVNVSPAPVHLDAQPHLDSIMGLFDGGWDCFNENDLFSQPDYSGLSYLDDQLLSQSYLPYT